MSPPVKAVVYGVGAMGALLTRLLVEKGVEIVGAVARSPAKVGRDLGAVAGMDRSLGVLVTDDAEALLRDREADIAIVAVDSYLETMAPHFRICLSRGVNVLTLEEETFYPWRRAPAIAAELDDLGRSTGATLAASGVQDVNWSLAVSALMATAHRIERVRGRSTWHGDEFGPAVGRYLHLGWDPAQATASLAGQADGMTSQTALEALAAFAGLTPTHHEVSTELMIAEAELRSGRLDLNIPEGTVRGLSEVVRLATVEGIELELEMAGFVHGAGETPVNDWAIEGEPALRVQSEDFPGRLLTCTTLVNRIPDILAAPAGLITVDRLPLPRYRPGPLRN
ncbi:MAG: dihydrodipicolinate reductase [Actinobacteria bacterium]|nr:dihydrodipicolinate reductase [Actinomycetota bacterium]